MRRPQPRVQAALAAASACNVLIQRFKWLQPTTVRTRIGSLPMTKSMRAGGPFEDMVKEWEGGLKNVGWVGGGIGGGVDG